MESFEFLKVSVDSMIEKSKNAEKIGNVSLAKQFNDLAIKQIKKIIDYYPNQSHDYRKMLNELDYKEFKCVPLQENKNQVTTKEIVVKKEDENKEEKFVSLQESLDELDKLIGLKAVKERVKSWINSYNYDSRRKDAEVTKITRSYHLVFSGNPGTGKTTVARIIANICKALGMVSKGHIVEVSGEDLIAGYVGQTAIKTKEVIDRALGGVLFIDEAYSITEEGNSFSKEAVATLLRAMENSRGDLIVIAAGYKKDMDRFVHFNPGLESRFKYFLDFEDYNAEELLNIFEKMCNDAEMVLTSDAKEKIKNYLINVYENRPEIFGNGRDVRKIFEDTMENVANRLGDKLLGPINKDDLTTIIASDIVF